MSANFDPTIFEFIYYQAAGFASSLALAIYEYFITIDQEIDLIWNRKFDTISVIFLLNRYCVFIIAILFFLQSFDRQVVQRRHTHFASSRCSAANIVVSLASLGVELASTVFFIFRIWTILSRHWLPLVILTPLLLFIVVTTCLSNFLLKPVELPPLPLPYGGCLLAISGPIPANSIQILNYFYGNSDSNCPFSTRRHNHEGFSYQTYSRTSSCGAFLAVVDFTRWFIISLCYSSHASTHDLLYEFTIHWSESNLVTGPTIVLTPILLSRFIFGFRGFDPSRDGRRDIPTSIRSTRTNNSGPLQFIRNIGASIRMTPARGDDIVEICLEDFPSSSTALSESMKDSDTHFIPRSFNLSVVTEQPRAIV
ncbi:hypothetical protein ABKN59_003432 [Abortiporus biennis]